MKYKCIINYIHFKVLTIRIINMRWDMKREFKFIFNVFCVESRRQHILLTFNIFMGVNVT